MMFPSDSWGKMNNPDWYYSSTSIPEKPNRKKNRKLSRQIRRISKAK